MARIKLATRQSQLALWQAEHIASQLKTAHPDCEIELVKLTSSGDKVLDRPLAEVGGKGLFIKELEVALLDGRADIAVHSMKDVPAELDPRFCLSAVTARETPNDAFVSKQYRKLTDLPYEAVVGTSSFRRGAQIKAIRPDITVKSVRGNVPSRIAKMEAGDYDALILATAGLKRLGLDAHIRQILSLDEFLPSVGQGIVGIECLSDNTNAQEMLAKINDASVWQCVQAERALNLALSGDCHSCIGSHAVQENDEVYLQAQVLHPAGKIVLAAEGRGKDALKLGQQVADKLLQAGARTLLDMA